MNVSAAMWCSAHIVELNMSGGVTEAATLFGTAEYWVFLLLVSGLSGSPTFWFIFSAAFTRRTQVLGTWIEIAAYIPLVGTVVVAFTNPWHLLYATPQADGSVGYGPLMLPLFIGMYLLVGFGISFMFRFPGRGRLARTHAAAAAWAAIATTLAGLVWNLRGVLGLSLEVNPSPIAASIFTGVLAWLVFSESFGEIVPSVATMAFRHASDAAMATDEDLHLLALNDAGIELFPEVSEGDDLARALPEIASGVVSSAQKGSSYEVRMGDKTFVARARSTGHSSRSTGYVVLLTDVSVLRQAEKALSRVAEDAQEAPTTSRWAD